MKYFIGFLFFIGLISYRSPVYNPIEYSYNNAPGRAIGTSYQNTSAKPLLVNYSVTHTITLTLVLATGSSSVFLEVSTDGTTWSSINQNGYSDGVAVAVSLTKTVTNNVEGIVEPGKYWRLRAVTSGAGTSALTGSQEVYLP